MNDKKWEEVADLLADALLALRGICNDQPADPNEVYGQVWTYGEKALNAWAELSEVASTEPK